MAGEERATSQETGERIALLVDSCCDVPPSYLQKYPFYLVPMHINYSDGSYLDRIDITPAEVVERLALEIPSTSTPTAGYVHGVFERIAADGFTHVVCISISSGLSSTYDLVLAEGSRAAGLVVEAVDTRSIGIGAGATAMYAAELLAQGCPFRQIVAEARAAAERSHVFFAPSTLEYLYKGGRINRAVYSLGSMLNLCPIITCDAEGKYAVCAKPRGKRKAMAKLLDLAESNIIQSMKVRIIVAQGAAEADVQALLASAYEKFEDAWQVIYGGELSPALVVHAGPGLVGIVVQNLDARLCPNC